MSRKRVHAEKSLVATAEVIEVAPPMVLASGNEAVAEIAHQLIKLSPSQRTFLRLRYYYDSDGACATQIGVGVSTVKGWKNNDAAFITAYNELLIQPLLHARAELLLLSQKAIHTLGDMLDSPNPQTRAAAVDRVLKGRDAQLISNSLKVEAGDGGDLYTQLLTRLASRGMKPLPAPAESEVIDAEVRVIEPDEKTI